MASGWFEMDKCNINQNVRMSNDFNINKKYLIHADWKKLSVRFGNQTPQTK